MIEDLELLRRYAKDGCAKSFELIVRRHIGWVYSASLRQVRDAALAEDVTQSVFVLLERRAATFKEGATLSGWLFNTLRFCAREAVRKDRRRRRHEARAAVWMQTPAPNGIDDAIWEKMSPLLEEAVASLGEADRQAVLLRFYEGSDFAQIGKALGISEVTARKRVSRAVKKLGAFFKQRGIIVPAVVLGSLLFAAAGAQAAPAGLAGGVLGAAGGGGAAVAGTLVRVTTMRFLKARRRLAAAIVACMGIFGIGFCLMVVVWMDATPEAGGGVTVRLSPGQAQWPLGTAPLPEDDFSLPATSKSAFARFDFAKPKPQPRTLKQAEAHDALWWVTQWFDLRHRQDESSATAGGNRKGEGDDELMVDPETGEVHPRSWFNERLVPSFVEAPRGGGGGGGGATADARAGAAHSDGAKGGSAGRGEYGGVFEGGPSVSEVVVALSSSATSTAIATPELNVRDTIKISFTLAGGRFNGINLNGLTHGLWYAETRYVLVETSNGGDKHLALVKGGVQGQPMFAFGPGSEDGQIADVVVNMMSIILINSEGKYVIPADELPSDFNLTDAALVAELEAALAKEKGVSVDKISLGFMQQDGTIVWASVPEPGAGMMAVILVYVLGRRDRLRDPRYSIL